MGEIYLSMHPIVEAIFEGESPKSVLEVGCQQGLLMKQYTDGKDIKVYGIDKEQFDFYGEFIQQDACEKWPLKDKSIDLVFSIGTLLLIKDPFLVLKEMLRVGKNVVLAEFHDLNEDEYGRIEQTAMYEIRVYRNYEKLLNKLGYKVDIKQVEDKWLVRVKNQDSPKQLNHPQ